MFSFLVFRFILVYFIVCLMCKHVYGMDSKNLIVWYVIMKLSVGMLYFSTD